MQRKVPLPGKIFTRCILQRRFAGHFGCMAHMSCQSQLISDAWRANLATNWRFSRPRPLSGCMERKTCPGLPPGDAPRRNLATARPPGTHQGIILPRPDARAERPARPCATAPARPTPRGSERPPVVYAARHPDAAELRVLQAVRALAVAQPVDCRVAAERVVNIAKLVSVPQRRSATTPCATMSCAAAPQRHALQHRVAMHHDIMHRTRRFCRR